MDDRRAPFKGDEEKASTAAASSSRSSDSSNFLSLDSKNLVEEEESLLRKGGEDKKFEHDEQVKKFIEKLGKDVLAEIAMLKKFIDFCECEQVHPCSSAEAATCFIENWLEVEMDLSAEDLLIINNKMRDMYFERMKKKMTLKEKEKKDDLSEEDYLAENDQLACKYGDMLWTCRPEVQASDEGEHLDFDVGEEVKRFKEIEIAESYEGKGQTVQERMELWALYGDYGIRRSMNILLKQTTKKKNEKESGPGERVQFQ